MPLMSYRTLCVEGGCIIKKRHHCTYTISNTIVIIIAVSLTKIYYAYHGTDTEPSVNSAHSAPVLSPSPVRPPGTASRILSDTRTPPKSLSKNNSARTVLSQQLRRQSVQCSWISAERSQTAGLII